MSAIREKARSIAVSHDLELRSDLLIKLLLKNCRFKFDLLLLDGLKANHANSENKFENVYTLFDDVKAVEDVVLDDQIGKLEQSIKGVHPESCLIIESINLLLLNYDRTWLNAFINRLLGKYCKIIFLFDADLIDADQLLAIQELATAYFELNRKPQASEIHVQYVYKKKCAKLGLDLVRGEYSFTFDTSTHLAARPTEPKANKPRTEDYSYDLSFNLTIKDEERQQTVLPFMRHVQTLPVCELLSGD